MRGLKSILTNCRIKNAKSEIEIFTVDTEAVCENCGFVIYNDTLTCVQWCKYARKCFGDEAYEQLMKAAERQKEKKKEAAEA